MRSFNSLRVGSFLAFRAVKRSSRYVTVLIIIILTLTFLNLVAVGGLLIGMMKGAEIGFVKYMFGSVTVRPLADKEYVQRADELIGFAKSLPGFEAYAPRITASAQLESNYKERKKGSEGESVLSPVIGIDPVKEAQTTLFPDTIVDGRYLNPDDRGKIILGSIVGGKRMTALLGQSLGNVYVGDKILVSFPNGVSREFEVIGFLKSKFEILDMEGFISLKEMQEILGINDGRVSEIAIKTDDYLMDHEFKQYFVDAGYDKFNDVQTWSDGLGAMMKDVLDSIGLIADIIGGIGLIVSGITIFILIFINAVSKRRFIGVLKASGLTSASIVWSFVLQAVFYTSIAVCLGLLILYGVMVPYLNLHPIDFAFADGIIYVTDSYVALRVAVLIIVSIVSGLVPAYMIAKENTLNAILQR